MAHTKSNPMYIFDWEIQNFHASGHIIDETIKSPVFFTSDSKVGLQIVCYPRGQRHFEKNKAGYFLKVIKLGEASDEVSIRYTVSILDVHRFINSETRGFGPDAVDPGSLSCSSLYISSTGSVYIRCHIWSIEPYAKSYPPRMQTISEVKFRNSESDSKPKRCSGITRLLMHSKSVFWPIKNFISVGPDITLLKTVKTGVHDEFLFHITLCVRETHDGKIVGAEIRRKTHNKSMRVLCNVKTIGTPKSLQLEGPTEYYFSKHKNGPWNFNATMKMGDIIRENNLWCIEDTLYLCFEFRYSVAGEEVAFVNPTTDPGYYIFESPDSVQFCESFSKHITLQVADENFLVDETVLTSKSSVFCAMFSYDMQEKLSKCVDIKDFDSDTVRRLLIFLSVDQIDHMSYQDALKLYHAATKYDIEMLICKCRDILVSYFCSSTVCDLLLFAEAYCDKQLLLCARGCILENIRCGFAVENWRQLKNNKDKLVIETYNLIVSNLKKRGEEFENEDSG